MYKVKGPITAEYLVGLLLKPREQSIILLDKDGEDVEAELFSIQRTGESGNEFYIVVTANRSGGTFSTGFVVKCEKEIPPAPTLKQRVTRGAKYLDSRVPGWADKINLLTLDMWKTDRCVLGQIHRPCRNCSPYEAQLTKFGLLGRSQDFAFGGSREEMSEANLLWEKEIKSRLKTSVTANVGTDDMCSSLRKFADSLQGSLDELRKSVGV